MNYKSRTIGLQPCASRIDIRIVDGKHRQRVVCRRQLALVDITGNLLRQIKRTLVTIRKNTVALCILLLQSAVEIAVDVTFVIRRKRIETQRFATCSDYHTDGISLIWSERFKKLADDLLLGLALVLRFLLAVCLLSSGVLDFLLLVLFKNCWHKRIVLRLKIMMIT